MLSVCIMNSYPGDRETTRSCKELLRAIFSQSHRLSTCDFSSTSSSFWNNWAFPAPKLRKLTIKGYGTGAPFGFHGQAPLLESVTLLHYLPWPLGNYPSLRQVDLWNREHRDVSLALLLDALRGCEVLEELALHGYAHLANEVSHPAPVPLPRLLKVDFFSCDSALILEHLETRSPECFVTIFDLNPGQDILRSLPRDQSRALPYLWGITELRVVLHSYSSQYHIAGHREDGSVVLYIAARGVDRSRWAWVRASIGAIASFSHFSSTRKLTLSTDIPFISWDMWLPNLNHLQDLTVSCPRSEGLLRGLLGSSPQTGLPFCPSLQNLALYQCGGCAIVDGLGLIKFVVSRYSAGRPLRQLSLHKGDWDRIQQLDSSWAALAQSQCACSRQECLEPTNAWLATRGGNVFINLPLNMDVEGLGYRYCTSDGVGWV